MSDPVVNRRREHADLLAFSACKGQVTGWESAYLLQGLVVDEACCILWDLELAFLDLLAKLPVIAGVWVS